MRTSNGSRGRRRPSRSPRRSVLRRSRAGTPLAVCAALFAAGPSAGGPRLEIRWQRFTRVPGVLDVAGPRADGRMVVAAAGGLSLLGRTGSLTPYARGADGYVPARGETYIAL